MGAPLPADFAGSGVFDFPGISDDRRQQIPHRLAAVRNDKRKKREREGHDFSRAAERGESAALAAEDCFRRCYSGFVRYVHRSEVNFCN